jgi:hypothetical protein
MAKVVTDSDIGTGLEIVAGKLKTTAITKADIGLGNVDNTSDADKPVSTATATAISALVQDNITNGETSKAPSQNTVFDALTLKANLASPSLTGTPTAPTATAGTNTTQVATTAFVTNGLSGKQNTISGTENYLTKYGAGGVVDTKTFEDGNDLKKDIGNYVNGANNTSSTGLFKAQKTITQHAVYGFIDDSTINYGQVALQAHASFNDNVKIAGIQNSDHHHSFQSYPHYSNSGILTDLYGFFMQPDITAGTVTNLAQFRANNPLGTGIISNLYGLFVPELTRGTSQNYAVFTQGATPSLFSGNTYFGSRIGIGTITPTTAQEIVDTNKMTGTNGNFSVKSSDSQAANLGGQITLGGSYSGTLRTVFGGIAGRKANSTNNDIGGYLALLYSNVYTGLTEGARLNESGNLLVNTTADNGIDKLQINGTISATQYKLSALNTAPASATATGTLGEVRITATHIYVCTATNTWVRTALSTW